MKKKVLSLLILIGIAIRIYSQTDVVVFSGNTHSGCYNSNPVTSAPQQKWEFEMSATNCSEPIIVGDKILVNAYDKENNKGYQFALDKNTGKQIWRNNIPEQLSTPTVTGNKLLYGSKSKLTIALDLNNGNEIWRYTDISGMTCFAPAIVNGRAYFGTHGKEWCIVDINTGSLIKKQTNENGICCSPSWDDKHVYFTDWDGNLHKQDIFSLTDTVIYRTDKSSHVAPTITGNCGLMTNDNGLLISVNLDTGEEIWRFDPRGKLWRSPSVKDSICIIVTDDSHIYGIDTKTGNTIWDVKKEGVIYTSASIADDIAYINCGDKKMYAFGVYSGEEIWQIRLDDVAGQPFIENETLYFTSGAKVYAYVSPPPHPVEPEMVFVQGGTFLMGCTAEQGDDCYDWEKPAHQVTVSSFNIGKYPVTVAQFREFVNATNYITEAEQDGGNVRVKKKLEKRSDANWRNPYFKQTDNDPVVLIAWNDAQRYIEWLNQVSGKNYRLATEAEWEYAARGGSKSKGYKYSGSDNIDEVAWYGPNSGKSTHPVGTKMPNELGIYDMNGNVWEWCGDYWGEYPASPQQDPVVTLSSISRVNRGGSWLPLARNCRVSSRGGYPPSYLISYIGFRVAISDHAQFKIAGNSNHHFCFQGEPVKSFNGVVWTHRIENNSAGVSMVTEDMAFCSDTKGYLYAIDCKTGDLIWKFNAGSKLYDGPNIKDNTAYLGTANGTVFAIDLSTGKEKWRIKTDGNVCFPPNLKDNLGYALSHDKKLYVFDLESGEIQDTIRENHVLCGTPTIKHDNIYYSDWGGNFHCVDLNSREKKWTFNTKEDSKQFTNPSIPDSLAYFVYDSALFAVNSKSGELQWTFKSDGKLFRTPAIKDNLLVFTTEKSHLYAFDITTKEIAWDFRSEGTNWSRPIIVKDVVYYASGNKVIYAFDLKTGNKYWEYKFPNETNVPLNGNSAPYYYNKALYIANGNTVYKIE